MNMVLFLKVQYSLPLVAHAEKHEVLKDSFAERLREVRAQGSKTLYFLDGYAG